jgi:hypothetical protein
MLQVDVTEALTVLVAVIVVVTICLHLYFREIVQGKERGLYPPYGWS